MSTTRQKRRAVAAVECAILLPILCFFFVVAIDVCRIFFYSIIVTNCARNGAFYGCVDRAHATDANGIAAVCQADATNLDFNLLNVASQCDDSTNPSNVVVTVTYPFSLISSYPGIEQHRTLSCTVRMSILPQTPTFN